MHRLCCAADGAESDSQPIWLFPRAAERQPLAVLGATCSVVFLVVFIVVYAGHLGLTEETRWDWTISDTDPSERWDGFENARTLVDEVSADGAEVSVQEELLHRGLFSDRNNLMLLWKTKDGSDIFTPANLQTMCSVEQLVLGHPEYESKLCALDYSPNNDTHSHQCRPQMASILTPFYDTTGIGRSGCPLLDQGVVDLVKTEILNPAFFASTAFFLGSDILDTPGKTTRTRSVVTLGGPVTGCPADGEDACAADGLYAEMPGRRSEQQATHYNPFWASLQDTMQERFAMEDYRDTPSEGNLELCFWGSAMGSDEFNQTISSDLFFSIGSILIVLCFLIVHTRSFFLGGCGMLQILMSMPCSLFIYRTILGVEFVTQLHVLSIYLVLGIGADDLFVFYDAWMQSALEPPSISGSDLTRLNYAYQRAAGAMLTTSFTTAIAFIATASSPVMPISAFGYFAACCIIMNYVLVMTVFPGLLMVWHKTGSKNFCCCDLPIPGWVVEDSRESSDKQDSEPELRLIERFYVDYFAAFANSNAKFGLVGVWALYFLFSAYWAFQMEPPVKPEQWFPDDHMLTKLNIEQREYLLRAISMSTYPHSF